MFTFFAALPAILGLAGFVIFQILRSQQRGDSVTPNIVKKLRADHPNRFKEHESLSSKQLHDLLMRDQELQKAVGEQDFELLGQTLKQQHVQAMFVYAVTAGLFVIGVAAFIYQVNRPAPTKVSGISLESVTPEAGARLVDLDDLRISWQGSGTAEPIKIYLENIETGKRTEFWNARSTDGELMLNRDRYQSVISNRTLFQSNWLRVIAQTECNSFFSEGFEVHVGGIIVAVVFEERVKVGAMIDNVLVDGYQFEMTMVTPKKGELDYLTLTGEISGVRDFPNVNDPSLDWGSTKIVYLGPDDPRLFRTAILYDSPS